MQKPPLPPTPATQRLLTVSLLNGWSITIVAGLSLLITLVLQDGLGIAVSVVALGAGLIELRGRARLKQGDSSGGSLLIAAQWLLMGTIYAYCLWQLVHVSPERVLEMVPEQMRSVYERAGQGAFLRTFVRVGVVAVYGGVMLASLLHQGGLIFFYRRSLGKVDQALEPPPIPMA